jgi:3-methyladenine DNA glycosylase AlkD
LNCEEDGLDYKQIIKNLKDLSNPQAVEGMAKFGITTRSVYGVSIPELRNFAKKIGKDHGLAQILWKKDNRETRILASMIDDFQAVTEPQMEDWVKGFDSWEICDQCCMNRFEKTGVADKKALEWSTREEEFVKRAGFVICEKSRLRDDG